jgi:hypothetical protein
MPKAKYQLAIPKLRRILKREDGVIRKPYLAHLRKEHLKWKEQQKFSRDNLLLAIREMVITGELVEDRYRDDAGRWQDMWVTRERAAIAESDQMARHARVDEAYRIQEALLLSGVNVRVEGYTVVFDNAGAMAWLSEILAEDN